MTTLAIILALLLAGPADRCSDRAVAGLTPYGEQGSVAVEPPVREDCCGGLAETGVGWLTDGSEGGVTTWWRGEA